MRKTPLILMAAALPMAVNAANTEFSYGGYVKLDATISQYSEGEIGAASAGRDFYVPSTIPTSPKGTDGDSVTNFDIHAKTSRFNFKTVTDFENGQKITSFIELDFMLAPGGNEVVSNSYNPRLRHAFIKTGNWLFGQTWSTFMNVGALPETADFLGVSDGTVFSRQAMIRYTNGNFQFALENSETTTPGANDDGTLPDVVARYNFKAGKNAFTVAAIGRQLSTYTAANGNTPKVDESTLGFGISLSGKIAVGADDIKFAVNKGAIGRYVGLSEAADAVMKDGDLEATDVTAAFIGYRHFWNSQLRSTVAYSMLKADYDVDNTGDTESSNSVRVNLMYSPVKKLTYGVELSQATHKLDNDAEGDLTRVHFTTKYAF
ncbi:DcaP family trimeric outer membrane transporter [Bacterioplanoides sp.]|uniref:DcaP family trimeric outer membrane transporter n=1 Tax=Bacterioplanoides sp. TaxID=2066072 RepID=UPI003B5B6AAD